MTAHLPALEAVAARTRWAMVHPELGIYLGSCMGLGFWSLLDPVGQPVAVTFASPQEGRECAASWDDQPSTDKLRAAIAFRPVAVAAADGYATIEECVAAGLPTWNPEATYE